MYNVPGIKLLQTIPKSWRIICKYKKNTGFPPATCRLQDIIELYATILGQKTKRKSGESCREKAQI